MLYGHMDPNERFRARRDQTRRTKRRRRAAVLAFLSPRDRRRHGRPLRGRQAGRDGRCEGQRRRPHPPRAPASATRPRPLPVEIRGVHVTGALASLSGQVPGVRRPTSATASTRSSSTSRTRAARSASRPADVPLARTVGATRLVLQPEGARRARPPQGIYMIGRVVCFQDPKLARERPDLAIQRPRRERLDDVAPGSAGSTPTTAASGTTARRSRRRLPMPASTRSCSTTCGSRPTATSTTPSTRARRASPRAV